MTGWATVGSPKRAAKALCSCGAQVGTGEEDDLVVEEGLADGGHRLGIEGLVEVEAADLGADGARERGDIELERGRRRHGWGPPQSVGSGAVRES